ncbi:uncharacterized protein TNCV_4855091 [Trichonephila clavipes]|nr:uncharacterized protein TNCV_4855091 [Trichonephila clavipes]
MSIFPLSSVVAVAEWYRYRIVAGFVTSSSSVPFKTRRVGQRCTLNLSRAETSRWCGVVVRRGECQLRCRHVTLPWFKITWSVAKSPRVAEQCDVNIHSLTSAFFKTLFNQLCYKLALQTTNSIAENNSPFPAKSGFGP